MSDKMRGDLKEKKVKQSLGEPCWEKEYKLSLIDVLVQRAEKWQSRKPPWECSERFGSPATRHNWSSEWGKRQLPSAPPAHLESHEHLLMEEGPEKTGTAARFDAQGLTSRRASRWSSIEGFCCELVQHTTRTSWHFITGTNNNPNSQSHLRPA